MTPLRRRRAAAIGVLSAALAATALVEVATTPGATPALAATPALVGTGGAAEAPPPASAAARAAAVHLRRQVEEIDRRLAAVTSAYESARHDLGTATAAQRDTETALAEAEDAHSRRQAELRSRVRRLYASGGGIGVVAALLRGQGPPDVTGGAALLQGVLAADAEAVRSADRTRRETEAARDAAELAARSAVGVNATAAAEALRLEALLAEQTRLLAAADAEVRRLVEEERERARAARAAARAAEAARAARSAATGSAGATGLAVVPGGVGQLPGSTYGGSSADPGRVYRPASLARMACPVGSVHSFSDTWLASRSGGRRHQGTDVFAPLGSTAYAVVDGVVDKVGNGGLGGITLWLRADSGDRFYYAHNAANLVRVGDRVAAGQPVARVGKTGNAASTPPHVHFEAHPGGGPAANPYAVLAALCG